MQPTLKHEELILRRRSKQLGAKAKARRKKCDVRFSFVRRKQDVGIAPTERLKLRRQMAAAAAGKT